MGPDAMILVFWMFSFKPTFSLSSFTFIKRLFSSSLSAKTVVSSRQKTTFKIWASKNTADVRKQFIKIACHWRYYLYTFPQSFIISSPSSILSFNSMVQHYPHFLTRDLVNNSKALLPVFITLFSSLPSVYDLACTTTCTCTRFPASVPIYFFFTILTRDMLTKPLSKPNFAACKQTTLLFLFILMALVTFFLSIILFFWEHHMLLFLLSIKKKKKKKNFLSNHTDHHHPIFWHLLTAKFFRKGV